MAFPGPTHFWKSISQVISDGSGEPEPSLLSHTKMRCTLRIRPLVMSLAQLGSWIFSFIMNDKMLKIRIVPLSHGLFELDHCICLTLLWPNKTIHVFRVTQPYLNLLLKPRFNQVFWKHDITCKCSLAYEIPLLFQQYCPLFITIRHTLPWYGPIIYTNTKF